MVRGGDRTEPKSGTACADADIGVGDSMIGLMSPLEPKGRGMSLEGAEMEEGRDDPNGVEKEVLETAYC